MTIRPAAAEMTVRYRDLAVHDPALRAALLDAVGRVLDHGRIYFGPEHQAFEEAVAHYCGRRHGIAVSSGTDAVYLALKALEIGPGDEVITTPLSWIATANAVVLNGATPVFVDIGEDLNINADLIEAAITPRTRAILPVHFTGQLCDMERIAEIAQRHGLHLVEDGAQAFGASRNGRMCGGYGVLSCFSMNPMKVFNAYGEAGAIVTDDEALRDRLVALRYGGTINKQDCHWPSINGRLDTIQAAMLLVSLERLPGKIERRRAIARAYDERLGNVVETPRENAGNRHIYYAYSIRSDRRDALMTYLAERGVETQIQHPIAMPNQTAYRGKYRAQIPVAERAVKRILCLPNQDDLSVEAVDYVSACVREFHGA